MTPLSLDEPLADLRKLSGLSHRTIGDRCNPRVSDVAVVHAEARGANIRLSRMAAYAQAAGYKLWLIANGLPGWALRLLVDDRLTMSVQEARVLIEGWGLRMELAVEPVEGSDG